MSLNEEAKKKLMDIANSYPARTVKHYSAIIELAKRIADADNHRFIVAPETVEREVKNILGIV